jgi:hypothetical protein
MFKIGLQTKTFEHKGIVIFSGLAISTDNRTQAALIKF